MPKRWMYNLLYRRGAPWEIGPRSELVALVESGRLEPGTHPRAIDLGCGSGANSVFLAEHGFEVTGVDFSPVALGKARALATEHGVTATFVEGDLTRAQITGAEGPFDLLVDYGTLDDFKGARRDAMAATIIGSQSREPPFCCGASAPSRRISRSSGSTGRLACRARSAKERSPACLRKTSISSGFPNHHTARSSDASC